MSSFLPSTPGMAWIRFDACDSAYGVGTAGGGRVADCCPSRITLRTDTLPVAPNLPQMHLFPG